MQHTSRPTSRLIIRSRRLVGAAVAVAAGALLVALLLLAMPSAGQAGSAIDSARPAVAPPTPPAPDPHWLNLLNSLRAHEALTLPSINVHLTDGFVAGHVSMAVPVAISVTRDATRVAYATAIPIPDEGGYFYLAYLAWEGFGCGGGGGGGGCGAGSFQTDDVVWVGQGSTVVSLTVPALSSLAAPEADRVFGAAPAGELVTLYLFPFATPDVSYTQTTTADGAGNYEAIWSPAVDLRPQDSGYVMYGPDSSRRVYIRFVAPFLRLQVGGSHISGRAAPLSGVAITVTDAGGAPLAWQWAYAGTDGSFDTSPGYYWPNPPLQPGYQVVAVTAGQTFSTTVLTVTAHADVPNGQVSGETLAGRRVEVRRHRGPLESAYYDGVWVQPPASQGTVTATAMGHYTVSMPLSHADYGVVLVSTPEGHQSYARFAVPHVGVLLGEVGSEPYRSDDMWLQGQVEDAGAPVTIAVQGPSGYLKGLRQVTAADNGYFSASSAFYEPIVLDSGDVLTVTTPRGLQVAMPLPPLTAEADPVSDTVSGLAPPGTSLNLMLWGVPFAEPPYGAYSMVVTATAGGEYLVDFGSLGGFTSQAYGELQLTTLAGHTVVRAFRARPRCQPIPGTIQVGGNTLHVYLDYGCPGALIRLRDAQGQLKYESVIPAGIGYIGIWLYDSSGRPMPINAGDVLEFVPDGPFPGPIPTPAPTRTPPIPTPTPVLYPIESEDEGETVIIVVPTLTAALEPATNVIMGQAPPGASLFLNLYGNNGTFYGLTATVSAQGIYSATLGSLHTLSAGDRVQVIHTGEFSDFAALGVLSLVYADLYQNQIGGWLPPLTPYTVTAPVSPPTAGYASTDGSFFAYVSTLTPGGAVVVTTADQPIQMTLPFLSAAFDRATATVSGLAPPNSRLRVSLRQGYEYYVERSREITASSGGTYTVSFPGLAPLQGAYGTVVHFNADGHQTRLDFTAARWQISLGEPCVQGTAETPGSPITVTLQTNDGTLQGTITTTAGFGTGEFFVCFEGSVQPGNRLTLTAPSGMMTFTVPNLTAEHSFARQVLEGQATPGALIVASFLTEPYYASMIRRTQAGLGGQYGMDTSDLLLRPGQTGHVEMTDEAGNTVSRRFAILGYLTHFPLVFHD